LSRRWGGPPETQAALVGLTRSKKMCGMGKRNRERGKGKTGFGKGRRMCWFQVGRGRETRSLGQTGPKEQEPNFWREKRRVGGRKGNLGTKQRSISGKDLRKKTASIKAGAGLRDTTKGKPEGKRGTTLKSRPPHTSSTEEACFKWRTLGRARKRGTRCKKKTWGVPHSTSAERG